MYITSEEQLSRICDEAIERGRIGIDLEFIPERTYYPQLALIQVAVGDAIALIDPLGEIDLSPFDQLVLSPHVRKVLHAGGQDLWILQHRTGQAPRNVFDTQVAAAFVGLGHQISYARAVEQKLGIALFRDQSFTDWLKRPLSSEQEAYALDDVRHLLALEDALVKDLESMGRLQWVQRELLAYEDEGFYESDTGKAYEKVRRTGSLKGVNRAIMIELAAWREREARRLDKPRRKILPDEALVEVARIAPRGSEQLSRCTGLSRRDRTKHGRTIVDLVRKCAAEPAQDGRQGAYKSQLSEVEKNCVQLLFLVLRSVCDRADLATALVGTKADVENLVTHLLHPAEGDFPKLLQGWRAGFVGEDMVRVLNGEKSVTLERETGLLRI